MMSVTLPLLKKVIKEALKRLSLEFGEFKQLQMLQDHVTHSGTLLRKTRPHSVSRHHPTRSSEWWLQLPQVSPPSYRKTHGSFRDKFPTLEVLTASPGKLYPCILCHLYCTFYCPFISIWLFLNDFLTLLESGEELSCRRTIILISKLQFGPLLHDTHRWVNKVSHKNSTSQTC